MDFEDWRVDTPARVFAVQISSRDRRLIESAAMLFPSVVVERCDILLFLDWSPTFQRSMCPMRIIEVLEFRQFPFQVRRGPEQHPIQAFSSKCADQPFDIRMGHRNLRNSLDFGHTPHPKVGLPLVEPVQRIVVGTEILRTRLPSNSVVEHAAHCPTVNDSGMDTEADDPSCEQVAHRDILATIPRITRLDISTDCGTD